MACTVSIGVAEAAAGEDAAAWIGRADHALYRCKQAGRNHVAIEPSPRTEHVSA